MNDCLTYLSTLKDSTNKPVAVKDRKGVKVLGNIPTPRKAFKPQFTKNGSLLTLNGQNKLEIREVQITP